MAHLPDREIALLQALVGVLYVARDRGIDVDDLVDEVKTRLLGNMRPRIVEQPHVTGAISELEEAKETIGPMFE